MGQFPSKAISSPLQQNKPQSTQPELLDDLKRAKSARKFPFSNSQTNVPVLIK